MPASTPPDIRIVLVEASHPGNIGAAARAMKNMGLSRLVLVRPKDFPHPEASARASGAEDLLQQARIVGTLAEALEGCGFIAATTSRERDQNFRVLDVRDAAERVVQHAANGPVAVLFGAERTGLTNDELNAAHALVRIPASDAYASLNLAMAVQLVAYEIMRAQKTGEARPGHQARREALASPAEMQRLYAHLGEVFEQIDFRDRTQSGTHLMARVRRFLQRAELDENEVNILRGMLTAVQRRRRRAAPHDESPRTDIIYLDYAATTPVDPRVAAAVAASLSAPGEFANPSSVAHVPGRQASARVEKARAAIASFIGARAEEIVFTSGATESNNLALLGIARAGADRGRHIVTSRIEHRAVLDPCRQLEREGFTVSYLDPDRDGRIAPEAVAAALRPDTRLVSIMHVSNEIGVVQDIAAIGGLCRARAVPFHSDAAQSAGRLRLDVRKLPVDLLSFTAHKLHGPKGIGALYVSEAARPGLRSISFGGGQERGLRPGTLPVHQIVGFAAACELAAQEIDADRDRLIALGERLWAGLRDLGAVHLNGAGAERAPGILNVSFEGVEGESLVASLQELAVSTGSACNSASAEPSYVLRALGRSVQLAQSSLRLSFGRFTTESQIDAAVIAIRAAVTRLRNVSPATGADALFRDENATGSILIGEARSAEGDTWVRLGLLVDGDLVKQARYQAYGCPHTLAVMDALIHKLPGQHRHELPPGTPRDWAAAAAMPIEKLGRLLVVEDALRACLRRWD